MATSTKNDDTVQQLQKYVLKGAEKMQSAATYVLDNYDQFPDKADNYYRRFQKKVKQNYRKANNVAYKAKNKPGDLTFMETIVLFVVVVGGGAILLQQVLSFYQNNLPRLMSGMIKFLVFLIIPLIATAATFFGMFLEHKHRLYPDVVEWLQDAADVIIGLIRKVRLLVSQSKQTERM